MNDQLSGWSLRYGVSGSSGSSDIADYVCFGPTVQQVLALVRHMHPDGYLKIIDQYRIAPQSKHAPALVYHRFLPVADPPEGFIGGYLGDREPRIQVGPEFPVIPSRGTQEERARQLDFFRRTTREVAIVLEGATEDVTEGDPWFDVETAYEFYRYGALVRTPDGIHETAWFSGASMDANVEQLFVEAVGAFAQEVEGEVMVAVGPHASTDPHPGLGSTFLLGRHEAREGVDPIADFESRVVSLDAWLR